MEFIRKNLKAFYLIWGVLMGAVLIFSTFVETDLPVVPILAIILFGGAALIRSWKTTVVEIVVEENAVHFEFFNGSKRSVIPQGVWQIRKSHNEIKIALTDKTEYRVRKGNNKITVRNGETVVHELREEDFPHAQFVVTK